MKANDFLIQTKAKLQEKKEQWKIEELFVYLQSAYETLQFDLPFFITKESLVIKKDKNEYYLKHIPLVNVSLKIDDDVFNFMDITNFYIASKDGTYSFNENRLLIVAPTKDTNAEVVYQYKKSLKTMNCELEIPSIHYKALNLLLMSEIHEKPTRNTKDRNLNTHYLKLYDQELQKLKRKKKLRPKNITSKYQIV